MITIRNRVFKERVAVAFCSLGAIFAVGMLFLIIGNIFLGAIPSLSLHFILTDESKNGLGQGIANAIIGTILFSLLSTILATPLAIGTAIYLKRYARENKLTHFIQFMIEVLSGTPSIVVGMFGLLVLVIYLQKFTGGFSLIAGVICLAILITPVIERSIESAIETVNPELEEGSYALGATKWQTIHMVTIPTVMSGVLTSLILGFGRAAEESSVLVLTAGYSQWLSRVGIDNNNKFFFGFQLHPLNDPTASLPYAVYNAYENTNIIPMSNAYAIAFILIIFVLLVNITGKAILSRSVNSGKSGSSADSLFGKLNLAIGRVIGNLKITTRAAPRPLAHYTGSDISDLLEEPDRLSHQTGTSWINSIKIAFSPSKNQASMDSKIKKTIPGFFASITSPGKKPEPSPTEAVSLREKFSRLFSRKKKTGVDNTTDQHPETVIPSATLSSINEILAEKPKPSLKTKLTAILPRLKKKPAPEVTGDKKAASPGPRLPKGALRTFLRAFIPFAIPAALLLLAAFLAGIPPLHNALGPASTSLAGLFASAFSLVITVAGLIFALIFAKKRGAFKGNERRKGFVGVAAGFCIVCIAALILSSAATGFFNTGDAPAPRASGDRSAQLAAMLASGELGDGSTPQPTAAITPSLTPTTAPAPAAQGSASSVPLKNALSVREMYTYGDATRVVRATVYNTEVLPFYFWWFIDYNRFVQETPAPGNTYLIVFLRLENTGQKSAVVPSADQFILYNNGNSYTHKDYINMSAFSQYQIDFYAVNQNKIPYQWIREIGQTKRDYAFITGYNPFDQGFATLNSTTDTATTDTGTNTSSSGLYPGYFIKPGSSNAIDGYLIYEVPDSVAKDLRDTYLNVGFNSFSSTRWVLG